MNHFQTILSDIFDRGAEHRLSQDEERETIHAAKAGDEAATVALLYAYAPALRNGVACYVDALGAEDARSLAVSGLLEALNDFDPDAGARLAGIAHVRITKSLSSAAMADAWFRIPDRMLQRFYGILRRADGDINVALGLAPQFSMARETFREILQLLRFTEGLTSGDGTAPGNMDEARSLWEQIEDAEDRILVEMAFAAVDDLEEDICRKFYGFTSYNPVPDGQIAADLGMTRPTVQRRRAGALSKMRDALGA